MPGSRTSSALSTLRVGRLRRTIAPALSACLVAALLPWTVFAQAPGPHFSGAAAGTAAEVTIGQPGTAPPVEVTVSEATGAINSDAGIIPDSPGSPENEAEDFAVGSATPARMDVDGETILQPGSVQSSAPADAGGERTVISLDEGPLDIGVLSGKTQSSATVDGSTASTTNRASVTDAVISDGVVTLGAATSDAAASRATDGTVRTFSASAVDEPTSLLNGLITAAAISATSTSIADGTDSSNVTDFLITDLALRADPAGDPVLSFTAGPSDTDSDMVELTITIPGNLTPATLTVPRGSNLLDPSTYGGSSLDPLRVLLEPILAPLVGPGGPLEGSELVIGGGFSEQGDGTSSRGLIEVLRANLSLADGAIVTAVLGRAFSAADAARASSNVTDPETPLGTDPATDPDNAFPDTRDATPAETIFTTPVTTPDTTPDTTPTPDPDPSPAEGPPTKPVAADPLGLPPADGPDPAGEAAPAADAEVLTTRADDPDPAQDAATEDLGDEAQADAPAEGSGDDLPFTGLSLASVAGMGLLLAIGGALVRLVDRRRVVSSR